MNFGVIGFGNIARRFAASIPYTTGGRICAIASRSLSPKDSYLLTNPDVRLLRDYDALLRDPEVEAVYIALPHKLHREWALKALRRHLPVLCEKPAVLAVEEMEEIARVSAGEHTYFLEALKTKFSPGMDQLRQDMALLGPLRTIETCFSYDASEERDSFLFDPAQGGALNDLGSYVAGFPLALMPGRAIQNISSKLICQDDGIDLRFHAALTFEGGVTALLDGGIDRDKDRCAVIRGELGAITIPNFHRLTGYEITLEGSPSITRQFPVTGDDMTGEIQALIDDVAAGRIESPRHTHADTLQLLRVLRDIRINGRPSL